VPVRALAIDLDGTLLDRHDHISPRNRAALAAARQQGLQIVIASARWFQIGRDVAAELSRDGCPIDGPIIACSGAQVRRVGDGVDLFDVRIPPEFARAFADVVDDERCIAWAALDDEVVMKLEGDPQSSLPGLRPVPTLAEGVGGRAPRLLLLQGSTACRRVEAELEATWRDRVRFMDSISGAGKRILTLTGAGADKGAALLAACRDLGVSPAEVVAFGDSGNDLPMFAVAGASVAMGQATDDVKAAASYVSTPSADDGVADAVERLLALGPAMFTR
jgi:hydroxymethylpyrimidine pyrophosphatase-like HAD family hydrolase